MMDANERKGFIEAVKAAAAVPSSPPEKLPGKTVEPPRTVTSPPRRQESSPREAFARE
jgi:hypothetical protein